MYKFELYNSGAKVAELTGVESVQYGYSRNDFNSGELVHNANSIQSEVLSNLVCGAEIRIIRNDNLVFAGEIRIVEKIVDEQGKKTIRIHFIDWGKVYFATRFVTKIFSSTAESAIAWGIIDEIQTNTQGGLFTASQVDWGIQQGELASGNIRDRTYSNSQVLKALQQLANVLDIGGGDTIRGFRLTPDLVDHRYHYFIWENPYGTTRSVTYTNPVIQEMNMITSAEKIATQVIANGDGIDSTATSTTTSINDKWKFRRSYISRTTVSDSAQLAEEASAELDITTQIPSIISFKPVPNDVFTGQYRVGDTIHIKYDDDFIEVDDDYIVWGIDVSYSENGIESTDITIATARPAVENTHIVDKLVSTIQSNSQRLDDIER